MEVDPQLTQGGSVPLDYPPCSQIMADLLAVNNHLAIAIQTFLALDDWVFPGCK